jgi:hypothetical protein
MSEPRKGESNPFFGKRHTAETRRRMSEAAKRRRKRGGGIADCYRRLIAAIVRRAIKDGAAWFLESGTGKSYCNIAGINPAKFHRGKA